MKVAVLGGGITGLVASFYLSKKGHRVTLIERQSVLGGLAAGFKEKKWKWHLERAYHHLFATDSDILNFAREIGFKKIFFRSPVTASLYENPLYPKHNPPFVIHKLDTPADLLRFPYLPLVDKLRAGLVLAFLKLSPFLSLYEKTTSEVFLKKTMGKRVWNRLWQRLFRGKFGDYAGIILASFIWARIKKRTRALGYIKGGFQEFINYLYKQLVDLKVNILTNYEIKEIKKRGESFRVNGVSYDAVVSTLPTPVFVKLTTNIFSSSYLSRFRRLKYLHAVTFIIETKRPMLDKTYWLNICAEKSPLMILAQHTNFIDRKNYGGRHLAYVGWYVKNDSPLLKMAPSEMFKFVKPHIEKITARRLAATNYYLFKGAFAQPIFDSSFVKNKPDFVTPLKNFYIANLDMTYPYDRGTNYAVKLGKKVSSKL
jgi:protoporphyrinogen oxidase